MDFQIRQAITANVTGSDAAEFQISSMMQFHGARNIYYQALEYSWKNGGMVQAKVSEMNFHKN